MIANGFFMVKDISMAFIWVKIHVTSQQRNAHSEKKKISCPSEFSSMDSATLPLAQAFSFPPKALPSPSGATLPSFRGKRVLTPSEKSSPLSCPFSKCAPSRVQSTHSITSR